ncbi:MAG: hypothetical protein HAW62_00440 [Endozoicomonadaceae bacterium]|nr:hypothetical protein [Endozoicomonadaceae bacterium]
MFDNITKKIQFSICSAIILLTAMSKADIATISFNKNIIQPDLIMQLMPELSIDIDTSKKLGEALVSELYEQQQQIIQAIDQDMDPIKVAVLAQKLLLRKTDFSFLACQDNLYDLNKQIWFKVVKGMKDLNENTDHDIIEEIARHFFHMFCHQIEFFYTSGFFNEIVRKYSIDNRLTWFGMQVATLYDRVGCVLMRIYPEMLVQHQKLLIARLLSVKAFYNQNFS